MDITYFRLKTDRTLVGTTDKLLLQPQKTRFLGQRTLEI